MANRVRRDDQRRVRHPRLYAGGELVQELQGGDAVKDGTVQCGHSASYYYVGKNKALPLIPPCRSSYRTRQQNAWMYYGGGTRAAAPGPQGLQHHQLPGWQYRRNPA
ncbi:MAG: hypothetical protein U1F55_06135 [Chitinivorax sp.]